MNDASHRRRVATSIDVLPRPQPTVPLIEFNQHTIGRLCGPIRAAGLRAGLARRDVESLLMAVSEVATNAIQHGGGAGWMTVRCEEAGLFVEVRDHGPGFRDRSAIGRAADGGLHVARALCHELAIDSSDDGVTVRMFTRSRVRRDHVAARSRPYPYQCDSALHERRHEDRDDVVQVAAVGPARVVDEH